MAAVAPSSLTLRLVGWSVTYILEKRGGSASSGYISSGFFGGEYTAASAQAGTIPHSLAGIMLGRFVLLWLNRKVSQKGYISLNICRVIIH